MDSPLIPKLPKKLYFKIGEVAQLTGLEAYVLRFWESEFSKINPKRTSSGQRLYRKKDVELIFQIKHLLYDQKYTIPGARQYLQTGTPETTHQQVPITIEAIKAELKSIRKLLS